jgi:hypothetical protein
MVSMKKKRIKCPECKSDLLKSMGGWKGIRVTKISAKTIEYYTCNFRCAKCQYTFEVDYNLEEETTIAKYYVVKKHGS